MRSYLPFLVSFSLLASACAADLPSAADVLEKVADRYKKLQVYEIDAETHIGVIRNGQAGSGEEKVLLAVGKQGMLRVERSAGDTTEIRVSDGTVTWKALPKQKLWSKIEVAQIADLTAGDENTEQEAQEDLFTRTQRSFVTRYAWLARYANSATFEKTERLKSNGSKVDCYVIRIQTKTSNNRLYIAEDSFLVLRHSEVQTSKNGTEAHITTDYKRISAEMPPPEIFEFQPPNGSKEVADVSLPSERNLSWVGRPAADFALKTIDGSPVHLADMRGKVVLLDFWATWCPPCRHELPTIEALSRKYQNRNVLIFGVNDEELQTAKRFLEKNHPDLTTLHDRDGKIFRLYGCYSIPTVLIINPKGTVVSHFIGERSESELVAALKQAGMN